MLYGPTIDRIRPSQSYSWRMQEVLLGTDSCNAFRIMNKEPGTDISVESLIVLFGVGNFLTFVNAGPIYDQSKSIIYYLKHTFEVSSIYIFRIQKALIIFDTFQATQGIIVALCWGFFTTEFRAFLKSLQRKCNAQYVASQHILQSKRDSTLPITNSGTIFDMHMNNNSQ